MEPNTQTIEKVKNAILEIINEYLPKDAKYNISYNAKYDTFSVDLWLLKIKEGDRVACTKLVKVAMLLHYLNTDGLQHYRCSGYGDVYCHASVSVRHFSEVILTPSFVKRTEDEAYKYCDKIFSEVEERLRRIEEEKERKRREYEEERRRNLGECYAERLDYDVLYVYDTTIARSILGVLKPGDKILLELALSIDPCFTTERKNSGVYVKGYLPYVSTYCRCKRVEYFEVFSMVTLPLYVYGFVENVENDYAFVVAEYKGDGKLEIVQNADINDYNYYLEMFSFGAHSTVAGFDVKKIEGAVWYEVYEWAGDIVRNLSTNEWYWASMCCEDDAPELLIPLLIRRGEEAKIRFSVIEHEEEEYEAVISARSFPPTVDIVETQRNKRMQYRCGC